MNREKSYAQCLDAMFNLRRFGMKLGLDTITAVLKRLGNPQTQFNVIHIAGTNGKGSTASMLAAILQTSGFKVGLFTSPHIIKFNERIQINGIPISDAAVVRAYQKVHRANENIRELTFFEMAAAMAFSVFEQKEMDWAIIETGMGGRLDATNVLLPGISIISNISLEHKEYLGNTLSKIAAEKAGIIKPGVPIVTAAKQPVVRQTIEKKARELKAPLFRLGRDFTVRRSGHNRFHYYGLDHTFRQIEIALLGHHQIENAALAASCCEVLQRKGFEVPETAIRKGLVTVQWPGRLEVVSQEPYMVLDGAHNLAAVKALARYLKSASDKKWTLVIGIMDDKPYEKILVALLPHCHSVIVTRPSAGRGLAPEILAKTGATYGLKVTTASTVAEALEMAVHNWKPGEGICVAGSLYVIGEAKSYLEKRGPPDPGDRLTSA